MREIAVSDEQYEYIEGVADALQAERVGRYGHVRPRDAIQYLIDTHAPVGERGDPADGGPAGPSDDGSSDPGTEGVSGDGPTASGDGGEADGGGDRLSAMMNLLETHAEKWGETPSENGRYEVELPDGDLEVVQTKDDVRAVLFKNY